MKTRVAARGVHLERELRRAGVGEVWTDEPVLQKYSHDASLFEVKPQAVVAPRDAAELGRLVRWAAKCGVGLTPRSGGTDMSGGAIGEGVVVEMEHFSQAPIVRGKVARVRPGLHYRDFERVTLQKGLLLPCYPASRELCTIGGMVANNAGGEKSLVFGKMKDWVERVRVVLYDGKEYEFGPLSPAQLKKKLEASGAEGEIYRKMAKLLDQSREEIEGARPRVSKDSTGYLLWEVWDRKRKTFNLAKLLVGSQGTLGILTEATVRLVRPKPHARMLVVFLKEISELGQLVPEVLEQGPESFESYDDHTLKFAIRYLPEILEQMRGGFFSLLRSFAPEAKFVATHGMPRLVLIAEFTDETIHGANAQARAAQEALAVRFPHLRTMVTRSERESKKYWVVRRESFNLLRKHLRHKHTAPFIDDIVVDPLRLPEFLPELERVMADYRLLYTVAGHIGNGNFHIIPLMDFSDPKVKQIIPELSEKVFRLVWSYGGSMSGEHNDGLIRSPYLKEQYGPRVYKLFVETKRIWDPHGVFNPGKKVGASMEVALSHLVQD